MIHRYKRPTQVRMENGKLCAFLLGDVWAPVKEVIDSWVVETLWWQKEGTVKRHYYSVLTSWLGIYELYCQDGQWILSGDLD